MDEMKYLLSSPENVKQLQEPLNELEEVSKTDFFGIWSDNGLDVTTYVRKIRQSSSFHYDNSTQLKL